MKMDRSIPLLFVLLVTLLMSLTQTGSAAAHQRLLESRPVGGDTLGTVPRAVHLRFSEPVQLALTTLSLIGPDGRAVALGEAGVASGTPGELVAQVLGPLRSGTHTVRWQTTGRDGHPVAGEVSFEIAPDAAGLAPPEPAMEGAGAVAPVAAPPPETAGRTFDSGSPAYVAVRWVVYVSLLMAIGACAFVLLVLRPMSRMGGGDASLVAGPARRGAALLGATAALALLAGLIGRLVAQAVALLGTEVMQDPARAGALLQTPWGISWTVQAVGALLVLIALLAARTAPAAFGVALIALIPVVGAQALTGHAAAVEGRLRGVAIAADAAHILAAGSWLGTLAVLLLAGVPAATRLGSGRRMLGTAALVNAFSPVALTSAAILLATGLGLSVLHVGSLQALTGTTYGATLLIKLALVVLILGAGAYNFLIARPRLASRAEVRGFRRSAGFELAIASLILLVTAVLAATARP